MNLLLDTHIFLWYITADVALPDPFRDAIRDPGNQVYLSVASIWEAVIKHRLGKLSLPAAPAEYLPEQRKAHRIDSLPIHEPTFRFLATLPPLHRDPFDRIIAAQAIEHGLSIVTMDRALLDYPVETLKPA